MDTHRLQGLQGLLLDSRIGSWIVVLVVAVLSGEHGLLLRTGCNRLADPTLAWALFLSRSRVGTTSFLGADSPGLCGLVRRATAVGLAGAFVCGDI